MKSRLRVLRSSIAISLVLARPAGQSCAQDPPSIVRGPYLQALLSSSVKVLWATDGPSWGRIEYRAGEGAPRVEAEDSASTAHVLTLDALSPGMVYRYRILEGERQLSEEAKFRTAPPAGQGETRAVVAGDSGSGDEEQLAVAALMERLEPDIFLHTGDLDYLGDPDLSIFRPYRSLLTQVGFYPTRGNHDSDFDWRKFFVPPMENPELTGTYYSFDWGSAHFVSLDTNIPFDGGEQPAWLASDLQMARASGIPWIILYFHRPVYTVGAYAGDTVTRRSVMPIADLYGVDLVLNGHDHNYQRSHPVRGQVVRGAWQDPTFISPGGTICLVTGGGGMFLYPEQRGADRRFTRLFREAFHALELVITPERLTARALSPENEVLDEFTIRKGPRPGPRFIRGDVDLSGALDVTDAVLILHHLFLGLSLECPPVASLDGSGLPLTIAEPIQLLGYLFLGGPQPAAPFPDCGENQDADDAWCLRTGCPR
jgi:hypothetical protein